MCYPGSINVLTLCGVGATRNGFLILNDRRFVYHLCPSDGDIVGAVVVASTWGNATKSRHFLRRYYELLQRAARGDIEISYVPDTENPSDFLTKWVSKAKFDMSIEYLTNRRAISGATTGAVSLAEVSAMHRAKPKEKKELARMIAALDALREAEPD